MELNGEVLVAAPRERVWAALNDADVLRRCIPGCEAMQATGEFERTATVGIKVGPVRARFNGRVRMEDVRPGEGCTLQFEGQGGAAGMARGSSRVELVDEAGLTRLRYQTQASVAGKLGQVGGRMIDAAARQMADQFFASFQGELAPPEVPALDPTATADAEAEALQPQASPPGDGIGGAAEPVPGVPDTTPAAAPAPAAAPVAPAPRSAAAEHRSAPAPAPAPAPASEAQRVLWFALGALSTGFGVWLARVLFG